MVRAVGQGLAGCTVIVMLIVDAAVLHVPFYLGLSMWFGLDVAEVTSLIGVTRSKLIIMRRLIPKISN
jgi:hypothetical protein